MTFGPSTQEAFGHGTAGLDLPSDRQVELVVGPGGVGKTTVAAALALRAAKAGRRTIVVTIDPSRRLAQALGVAQDGPPIPGAVIRVPTSAGELDCLLLDTQATFDAIVRQHSPDPQAISAILASPIYRAMVKYLGGALEYAATAQVQLLHAQHRWDLIVLDTPPTANAIDFLEAPGQIAEVANNPAAKFLAQSGRFGMSFLGLGGGVLLKALKLVGGGAFIADLGVFLRDFGAVLGEFQQRAGQMVDLLDSPGTGVVLTTSATDFSVREALAFLGELTARRLRVDGVVLNRVDAGPPPWPGDAVVSEALRAGPAASDESLARVREIHDALVFQAEHARQAREEIHQAWPNLPVCVVPRKATPPTTLAELGAMGQAVWPVVRTVG